MRKENFPMHLVSLIKNYLTNRSVVFQHLNVRTDKLSTLGCPQSSVLGPLLWNILFNDFLANINSEIFVCTAYADDLVIVVGEDSRAKFRNAIDLAVQTFVGWCDSVKMKDSPTKTKIMINVSPARVHHRGYPGVL